MEQATQSPATLVPSGSLIPLTFTSSPGSSPTTLFISSNSRSLLFFQIAATGGDVAPTTVYVDATGFELGEPLPPPTPIFLPPIPVTLPAPPDTDNGTPPTLHEEVSTTVTASPTRITEVTETPPETETETVTLTSTKTTTTTTTTTLTEEHDAPTITLTRTSPPKTVTNTIVVTLSPSPPPQSSSSHATPHTSASPALPSSSPNLPSLSGLEVWSAPSHLENLDPFNITFFPGSGKNLKIVTGIPPKASASPSKNQRVSAAKAPIAPDDDDGDESDSREQTLPPLTTWSPSSTSMQLLYPANSINPAGTPKGGEEFYASPLDLSRARNVSLRYSVYFPADFDWVLAGKLPGMYGGHTGCSGGNKALDCFSTRLMWRSGGAGELYLYAAKDKQTKALCSDPRSTCDAAYGFSIGRGSFTWAAGAWTTVTQTVVLNTPGKQDGAFTLDVNGKRVIAKDGVFYRDVLFPDGKMKNGKGTTSSGRGPMTGEPVTLAPTPRPTTTHRNDDPLGDILGPLLSEIGHLIRRRGPHTPATPAEPTPCPSPPFDDSRGQGDDEPNESEDEESALDDEGADTPFGIMATPQRDGNSIGFLGIFFSTFFGGHDEKYATPRDQYVWFKDFAMSYNA
ncbi:hypothetical protein DFP72DRAFT_1064945 [Ephemerocybe angulata]|uniref:Polysaccharide lyase 14 domain-containing protein n=1 Tax=Ephemerocybe angulata TaxID=980116 RepID=A0A8H6MAP9_9AGAR|nr:hypothetical protein DFP72DRAFT_1064945 [Tulosesus angulatus]